MIAHYLKVASRHVRRSPASAVVNVLTLALGLTCFVAASAIVGFWERAEQHFTNADHTFVVTSMSWSGIVVPRTNALVAELLASDFSEIEAVARAAAFPEPLLVSAAGRTARLDAHGADPEFLTIFDLPFVAGDSRTALAEPGSVVLTQAAARRLFGDDRALGQALRLDDVREATVTGVVREIPEPSHMGRSASAVLPFDLLASRDLYDAFAAAARPGGAMRFGSPWATQGDLTYVLLPADGSFSAERLRAQLARFVARHAPPAVLAESPRELELDLMPVTELLAASASNAVFLREAGVSAPTVLLVLGALVLLVASANYANLATARAALRGREVGVRKAVGAKRKQLAAQYLLDAALHTGAGLALALVAVRLLAPVLDRALGIDLGISMLADARSYALLTGLVVVVTLVAGAYPALVLSGVRPVEAIRSGVTQLGPRALATVLIGVQFAAASFLLVAVAIVFLQHRALRQSVLAEGADPLLVIENDPAESFVSHETLHAELLELPQVLAATTAAGRPWHGGAGAPPPVSRTPDAANPPRPVRLYQVGDDFFSTLGIPVLAGSMVDDALGRGRTPAGGPDRALPVIVDRDLTERLGFRSPEEAAGEIVYWLWSELEPGGPANPLEIVGVVENRRLNIATGLGPASSVYGYGLPPERLPFHLVRISGADIDGALAAIDALWRRLAPNVPLDHRFASEDFEASFESYDRIGRVFAMLALFAFLISTLGLLGMALLLANRRVHEIAVRKTLGARKEQMVLLLLKSLASTVVVANVVALPFALIFGRAYLGVFDDPIPMTPWPFLFCLAFTLSVAWIAVGQEAWRAASIRPSDVLRRE